jgi:hypothetical protein
MPDSNVWRYLVEFDAIETVRLEARRRQVDIVACPAVVFEAMRGTDANLRDRLVKAMTLGSWLRLMPEAFTEADEVRKEIERLHPEWLDPKPDRVTWQKQKADWQSGWWLRARNDTRNEAKRINLLGADILDRARSEAGELRKQAQNHKLDFGNITFDLMLKLAEPTEGWSGEPFDAWRMGGLNRWQAALGSVGSTDWQWLSPWVLPESIFQNKHDWVAMWTSEVEVQRLPREWLRWAFEYVQATRSTTPGTPVDNQISVYLPECDVFLSADKAFIDCVEKVRPHSPVPLGIGVRVPGGPGAIAAVMDAIARSEQR